MQAPDPGTPMSALAVVGFVLSLLGALPLVIDLTYLAEPTHVNNVLASAGGASMLAIPGLAVSAIARERVRSSAGRLRGGRLAVAGLVIALVTLFGGVVTTATCLVTVGRRIVG